MRIHPTPLEDTLFRRGLLSVLALLLLITGVSVYLVVKTKREQPRREIVASAQMDYCRSDANSSPDREAQLKFLRANQLLEIETHTWLDVMVGDWNADTIFVRYFTSDDPKYVEFRCQFTLAPGDVTPAKQRMAKYVRDGQPFTLGEGQRCLSTVPPHINADRTVATLRCDTVLP